MSILSKVAAYVPAMPSISSCRAQIGQYCGHMVAYITTGFSSLQTQVSKIAASASSYLTQAFAPTKPYVAQAVSKLPNLTQKQKLIGAIGAGLLLSGVAIYKLAPLIILQSRASVADDVPPANELNDDLQATRTEEVEEVEAEVEEGDDIDSGSEKLTLSEQAAGVTEQELQRKMDAAIAEARKQAEKKISKKIERVDEKIIAGTVTIKPGKPHPKQLLQARMVRAPDHAEARVREKYAQKIAKLTKPS